MIGEIDVDLLVFKTMGTREWFGQLKLCLKVSIVLLIMAVCRLIWNKELSFLITTVTIVY